MIMLNSLLGGGDQEMKAKLDALDKSQAVIEFQMDGTIISANDNFLSTLGYSLSEVQGKHHSMFVTEDFKQSQEYKDFWKDLNNGKFQASEYMRVGKGGKEVWIQASYNPIIGKDGKPVKVVKFATDITEQKMQNADFSGQVEAINKAQAVIHFNLDGTIIDANENFLSTLGYSLDEIKGQHHSMFVEPSYGNSAEYAGFWRSLNNGEFQTAEYKRIGKGGKEIWIQASYNPIFDANGKVFKVVKFATDVTQRKLDNADVAGQIEAISKAQAVIHFELDGTIIEANDNFLGALGYTMDEIKGKHHGMFVEPSYRQSPEYTKFWDDLRQGKFQSAEYKRISKSGDDVWIQASYNPIFDLNGKPFKIVKFATDITEQVNERQRKNEIQKDIAQELESISSAMDSASEQSTSAASASEQTNSSVQAVAAGLEEFDASISSVVASMQQSREASDDAYARTEAADVATKRLVSTALSMTGIVELIQNIASQINLLSLNATIEAARAGDAGRGFAVVANEVKNLASQAASATDQISKEIDGVQSVSNEVAENLGGIQTSLDSVRSLVVDTSSAVEQQSAAAQEMSGNMQSAATAVSDINVNINEIANATRGANDATQRVEEMSRSIA